MAKFITLFGPDGDAFDVNPEQVCFVRADKDHHGCVLVVTQAGNQSARGERASIRERLEDKS